MKKTIFLILLFLFFSSVFAKNFTETTPFELTDNFFNVKANYFNGQLILTVKSLNESKMSGTVSLFDSSFNKLFLKKKLNGLFDFEEKIVLEKGEYVLFFNNFITKRQSPKIFITLNDAVGVQEKFVSSVGVETQKPVSSVEFLKEQKSSLFLPFLFFVICIILVVVFYVGQKRDKELKELTGEHPMREKGEKQ